MQQEAYEALVEQNNREMDIAIRESESERDHIQVRIVTCLMYLLLLSMTLICLWNKLIGRILVILVIIEMP